MDWSTTKLPERLTKEGTPSWKVPATTNHATSSSTPRVLQPRLDQQKPLRNDTALCLIDCTFSSPVSLGESTLLDSFILTRQKTTRELHVEGSTIESMGMETTTR